LETICHPPFVVGDLHLVDNIPSLVDNLPCLVVNLRLVDLPRLAVMKLG
jgi:hypothetical protein